MSAAPEDYLTIDEVAERLALPPEMIRRRIESGDIPIHWVELEGKLEMRVSAEEVGVDPSQAGVAPFRTAGGPPAAPSIDLYRTESPAPPSEDWPAVVQSFPEDLWTPPVEDSSSESWESPSDLGAEAAQPETEGIPVWRPDPATWEDEPLQELPSTFAPPPLAEPAASEFASYQPGSSYSDEEPAESEPESAAVEEPEEQLPFGLDLPPSPLMSSPAAAYPESDSTDDFNPPELAEVPDYQADTDLFQSSSEMYPEEESTYRSEPPLPPIAAPPPPEEVTRPSALAAAPSGADSGMAVNSIDARELVAGLFERWERALEQRIQAEQRLRFEAELERRLRQVRDLRQELDVTRKSQAAQLAEHEREVMELRNKVREAEQTRPRGRLFKR